MASHNVFENKLPVNPRIFEEDQPDFRREELVWNKDTGTYPFSTITLFCPYCNKEVAAIQHISITKGQFAETEELFVVSECPVCMKPIIYDVKKGSTFPVALPFESVKNLPDEVATIFDECRSACGAGCYTASVILARTLLNHVAVDKGAEANKSFQYYVDYLVENFMPPKSKAWVDSIRLSANDSTHHLEIMKKEEAELVIKFVMYLLKYIYELPEELS